VKWDETFVEWDIHVPSKIEQVTVTGDS